MRVGTPLGEYPFEFRRIERREGSVAIVGIVAGLESSVVLGRDDLRAAARLVAPVLVASGAIIYWRRRCRRALA